MKCPGSHTVQSVLSSIISRKSGKNREFSAPVLTWPGFTFCKIHPAGLAGGADPRQEAFVTLRLSFEGVPQLQEPAAPSGVLVQLSSVLGDFILWRNSEFILLRFPHLAFLWAVRCKCKGEINGISLRGDSEQVAGRKRGREPQNSLCTLRNPSLALCLQSVGEEAWILMNVDYFNER